MEIALAILGTLFGMAMCVAMVYFMAVLFNRKP
jgi:hypothetical protein